MKKFCVAVLALALCLGLSACGSMKESNSTTTGRTVPTTLPTVETNIPDPEVNDNSTRDTMDETTQDTTTDMQEGTDFTHTTGETHGEDMGRRIRDRIMGGR